jgi:hypothetical protein
MLQEAPTVFLLSIIVYVCLIYPTQINMITETHNEVSSLLAVILLICKWLSYMSHWIYYILRT